MISSLVIKKLTSKKNSIAGRNSTGKITVYHRGGGHKKRLRNVDFIRSLFNVTAIVLSLAYDPNRSSFLALILYKNGILSYILATSSMKAGDFIISSTYTTFASGNVMPLKYIPIGSVIHNLELHFGKGAKFCRSAGSFALVLAKNKYNSNLILIRLKSGEEYLFFEGCIASLGVVSNLKFYLINRKKAGTSRLLGKRPVVRGVAMNPIDHPHGGGEGKTSGGRPSVTPWAKLTKGKLTRSKKRINRFIFKSRNV